MLEKEILLLLKGNFSEADSIKVKKLIAEHTAEERQQTVFEYLSNFSDQPLLLSIWRSISRFTRTLHEVTYADDRYKEMIETMDRGDVLDVFRLFR